MDAGGTLQFKSVNYTGQADGPRLIVTGAVHGNERCGTRVIERLMAELDSGALRIARGSLTLVPVANPLAYAKGRRNGQRDLNRHLFPSSDPQDFEDRAANWLCPLLARHDVLLDLHSFKAAGAPFALLGPRNNGGALEPFAHAERERALARRLGVRRCVDGWLRVYSEGARRRSGAGAALEAALRQGVGSTEYMRACGGYGLTLECGQHDDPAAPGVAWNAIMAALAFLGLTDTSPPAPLADGDIEMLHMATVHDRLEAGDAFCRPWASFDPLHKGQLIGRRADGTPVTAEGDGRILFPDIDAAPGEAWYYLCRPGNL